MKVTRHFQNPPGRNRCEADLIMKPVALLTGSSLASFSLESFVLFCKTILYAPPRAEHPTRIHHTKDHTHDEHLLDKANYNSDLKMKNHTEGARYCGEPDHDRRDV